MSDMEGTGLEGGDGARAERTLRRCVAEYGLDLRGLTVFTEAASGAYLHTPIMAALAGAEKVYALAADSAFGAKEEVRRRTLEAAARCGVAGRVEVVFEKARAQVAASDIVTNAGFVRPIDREMVSWMKPTAVVPLMWETWEFRESDLDLGACREKGILVLGTDESQPPLRMYSCGFYLAMKLIFELGLEGYKTRTLLLGGGDGLGRSISERFGLLGMEVSWFADRPADRAAGAAPYAELAEHFAARGDDYDVLIVAEHGDPARLLGEGGLLGFDEIRRKNPALRVGVISGNVDGEGLRRSGLRFHPAEVRPFGWMTYQPYDLGPVPVLELYAAGLKVGEAMARARLSGAPAREAARYALEHSAAMDFEGERAWL